VILSDIRKYMKRHGRASLDDLVARFDGDKAAIEGMMETLKAHGQVVELGCGGCSGAKGCSVAGPIIYACTASEKLKNLQDGSPVCG